MDNKEQTLQILSNATGTNTELLNIKVSPGVGDIVVQLDVFDQNNKARQTTKQSSTDSINLNAHLEVFQTIMQQVIKTPHETIFLNVLKYLLRIDPTERTCNIMWNAVEILVHRATLLENSDEAERLLNSSITQKLSCKSCHAEAKNLSGDGEKEKMLAVPLSTESLLTMPPATISHLPPPLTPSPVLGLQVLPALPVPFLPAPPPPPPPPPSAPSPTLPPIPGISLSPPTFLGEKPSFSPSLNQVPQSNNLLLPQQRAPKSSKKLKTLNWTKIPPQKIINKLNIWTIMANDRQYKCVEIIDFKGIEGLFCLQTTNKNIKTTDAVDGTSSDGKKQMEPKHIHLLDGQRSLKINIFLSQFKCYNLENIIQFIRTGDHKIMNLEKLKELIKFFERDEEIALLKNFIGDRQHLANAEKFLISMLEVSK